MAPGGGGGARKRQHVGSASSSDAEDQIPAEEDDAASPSSSPPPIPGGFNDATTADVLLRLELEDEDEGEEQDSANFLDLHLHSAALRRCRYFSALLSDRWPSSSSRLTLSVPSLEPHVSALRLLYTLDFPSALPSASAALALLPASLHLLFDDLARSCLLFLESVPWSDADEERLLALLPSLPAADSAPLLARLRLYAPASPDDMLRSLLRSAAHAHPRAAHVKAFVAKLLRDHPSHPAVRRALDRAFLDCLATVRDLLAEYASPDLRRAAPAGGDDDETEAIRRLSLHAAVVSARHLLWLVERAIELRAADTAVREWSEQAGLAADLQKTFRDDAWRNIAPGLSSLMMRCTSRLASAVAAGTILAPRQVRMKLVKDWLPVLNVCRDIVSPMPSGHKLLYQELEETFLRIISTLPMSDSQELLQQCLSFSTRNVDDCPHLVSAFNTWFRRANRQLQDDDTS